MGKSMLQDQIMDDISREMSNSIDRDFLTSLWGHTSWAKVKAWTNRRGERMYRVHVVREIREWLEQDYPQAGQMNPLWWKFEDCINMTEQMYTVLALRWPK